jgi:phosphoglycerol transferase MdoB-like AlkP superfamily enzyme
MNTNPYAPPSAVVADVGAESALPGRSKIVVIVAVNAALIGTLTLVGTIVGVVRVYGQGRSVSGPIVIAFIGALALLAGIGIFRHRLWAAITWCVLSGIAAVFPLLASLPMRRRADFVFLGFLVVQFVGSLLGTWAVVRKNKRANAASLEGSGIV